MKVEIVKAKDFGLEEVKAKELTTGLNVVREERLLLIEEFKDVSKLELIDSNLPKFKALRLKIVKNRTQGINKWHTTNKAFFLTGGKFVDAIKNMEIAINEEMESKLMDAEKHFENLEKERVLKLGKEREEELLKYGVDLSSVYNIGEMPDNIWGNYLSGTIAEYNDRIEAEKKAELERIEAEKKEVIERDRIRKENEKLKAESLERDRIEKIESDKRAKIESDRLASELKEKESRDKKERIEREANEVKLKTERDEKNRIQKQLDDAKEEALNAKLKEEAKEQAELNKGDSAKVKDLIKDLESLKTKYTFKAVKTQKMYKDVGLLIDKVANHINK
tara:strand:+ start:59 stop:1066 length:1008 start_codon:yes stop_codon:yes gene_type:complete